jgi:chromosome partitioning protein
MKTVLVANPKGGCGKTTLSVNIAGFLASRGKSVTLLDLDRQQSGSLWLATRPAELPQIVSIRSKKDDGRRHDWMVIDSPSGLHGKNLEHALNLASKIIVPVAPSLFDIHASHDFLELLAQQRKASRSRRAVGVVGMRMEVRTKAARALEHFLVRLDLPVLAYLRETQVYVNAAFEGKSLYDLPHAIAERELENWRFLENWLLGDEPAPDRS